MILKEGEAVPFGYGLVRHRPECIGTEVAMMPLNWLKRSFHWAVQKSYHPMTRDELKTLKAVKALMIEAEAKGRNMGWREGNQATWTAVTKIYMETQATDPSSLTDTGRTRGTKL